ncbi:serine hydrolase domain-containing protein [Rhodanobacter spathiphylli]|uniref:Beta-lactamase n=1 Tax=Rhodanobacter spathiphylli B39 TaxID=1163407 RepID=I4W3M7_9GAMM|nr:serine hydrolase domain-containing protein [Rhodanobacter spathiphylli]EIL94068.1 beta-lactamase [Rhodanobacter spathiphylli B39]
MSLTRNLLLATLFLGTTMPAPAAALKPAQIAAIDRYVSAEMARQHVPGVEVGVYRDGHALLLKGYGLANIEWQAPVTPATLMQSGSVGKQFAATAVMMLVEQGKLSLDDSITRYFPDAPAGWKAIRVKNLLSHTSGLAEYEDPSRMQPGGLFDSRKDFTEDELVKKIETLPIEFRPGERWDYRNTNYALLGVLIHKVTGQDYRDFMRERIFAPLGMVSTRSISERDIIPGRAAGYEIVGGQLKNQTWVSPSLNSTADGTLYFNVVDLEKWDRALYGTRLLSRKSLDTMWTPFLLNDGQPNPSHYGFGWASDSMNGHRVIQHSGAWQGFTCTINRYVDDKLTVVVLTNLDAAHASPVYMSHVIAGLVEPALMPKPNPAIKDDKPEIAAHAREVLQRMLAGKNLAGEFDADAGYVFDPNDAADMRSQLPAKWDAAPLRLIKRGEHDGAVRSVYRVGPDGDTRIMLVELDAKGKLLNLAVKSDPDNR